MITLNICITFSKTQIDFLLANNVMETLIMADISHNKSLVRLKYLEANFVV